MQKVPLEQVKAELGQSALVLQPSTQRLPEQMG
ncbi:MAG: hypothetical protein RLZZ450_6939, partial [Pseudomonadota bacterium]